MANIQKVDFILKDAGIKVKYGRATEMDFPGYDISCDSLRKKATKIQDFVPVSCSFG